MAQVLGPVAPTALPAAGLNLTDQIAAQLAQRSQALQPEAAPGAQSLAPLVQTGPVAPTALTPGQLSQAASLQAQQNILNQHAQAMSAQPSMTMNLSGPALTPGQPSQAKTGPVAPTAQTIGNRILSPSVLAAQAQQAGTNMVTMNGQQVPQAVYQATQNRLNAQRGQKLNTIDQQGVWQNVTLPQLKQQAQDKAAAARQAAGQNQGFWGPGGVTGGLISAAPTVLRLGAMFL